MFSFSTVATLKMPVLNITGSLSPHIDDTVTFNGRLEPTKTNWMKVRKRVKLFCIALLAFHTFTFRSATVVSFLRSNLESWLKHFDFFSRAKDMVSCYPVLPNKL